MAENPQIPRLAYVATSLAILAAAIFPAALMVFDPTLMFERGWEQYVGTTIYAAALFALARVLYRLWSDERALASVEPDVSKWSASIDRRLLPSRLKQLASYAKEDRRATFEQLMELNREASGLDQEHVSGRFTLTKYILYLLPVIGFIGTVEGISKALMNISIVLPMVKDLDAFLSNLTGVTSALQIAFDSTLLALFLSASLMFVQTLVYRRAEDLLARVDRWVVEHAFSRLRSSETDAESERREALLNAWATRLREDWIAALSPISSALTDLAERMGVGLGPHVERFSQSVDRLPEALSGMRRGAEALERFETVTNLDDSMRRGLAALGRIEAKLSEIESPDERLAELKRGLDRACLAVETMSQTWSQSFEKSSRATQEQLARAMTGLREALELLNVSMEQGNSLYRSIVKRMTPLHLAGAEELAA